MDWLSLRIKLKYRKFWRYFSRTTKVPGLIWIILMSIPIFFIAFTHIRSKLSDIFAEIENIELKDRNKGYLIKSLGCKIPDLPVFSSDMAKYFEYEFDGAHCNNELPPLVQSNLTSLYLHKDSLSKYNVSNLDLFYCCYKELRRKVPIDRPDSQYEFSSVCSKFQEAVEVKKEFVLVECFYDNEKVYKDLFAFIPPKHNVTLPDINREEFNILIIGIDGISRLNFHRQMNKSVELLKTMNFMEFLGYNKIADNTYPNLISVLTGENEKTIQNTCRNSSKYFDKCSFIWNNFKAKRYITSFAEDSAWMGIFNYQKYGFQKQPTDYMWGFFDRIGEALLGNSRSLNVIQCIGPREAYKMLVQYIYDFVTRMTSWRVPYFAFFWSSSLSHDDLNKPRIGDEIYQNLFKNMHENQYFDNTIVIVMSDHGMRFGYFRQTYQGRVEERLPFLFIRIPEKFEKKYPLATSNLKRNTRVLTTPLDLHETLLDLASPSNLVDQFILTGRRESKSEFGLSLFHKIEPKRTCEDAGISDHWCTCLDSSTVQINAEIIQLANFTVNYMNEMLSGYAECENLQLKNVSSAQVLYHKSIVTKETMKDYLINFQTLPGNGLFEATVREDGMKNVQVLGSISRLNFYGQQSACITDTHLKLYCYCRNLFGFL